MNAVTAGQKILQTIDRESPVDPGSDQGETIPDVLGDIVFDRFRHIYPSRPTETVLTDFHLTIPHGQVTAIVGSSGSGKSTVIGLIERFYLPADGEIFLDGHNIKDLNLRWLRSWCALVS